MTIRRGSPPMSTPWRVLPCLCFAGATSRFSANGSRCRWRTAPVPLVRVTKPSTKYSTRIDNDRELDALRFLCAILPDLYPPTGYGQYCSDEGIGLLHRARDYLKSKCCSRGPLAVARGSETASPQSEPRPKEAVLYGRAESLIDPSGNGTPLIDNSTSCRPA